MTKRRLNRKPARPVANARHYALTYKGVAPAPLPPSVDLRPSCSPVEDQGDQGSCTAHACAGGVEFLEKKVLVGDVPTVAASALIFEHGQFINVSRSFIYYNERMEEGDPQQDGGASLSTGAHVVETVGICREALWPYSDGTMYTKPAQPAYDEAARHKVPTAYQITDSYHMKHSLAEGYPFVFGITVFPSMMTSEVQASGYVPLPGGDEEPEGGHALLCVGYDDSKQCFLFRNSWGTGWGMDGYAWIPYAYLTDPYLAEDFWTFRLTPDPTIQPEVPAVVEETKSSWFACIKKFFKL